MSDPVGITLTTDFLAVGCAVVQSGIIEKKNKKNQVARVSKALLLLLVQGQGVSCEHDPNRPSICIDSSPQQKSVQMLRITANGSKGSSRFLKGLRLQVAVRIL